MAISKTQKKLKVPPVGMAHVKASFNNTIICITDLHGNVVAWSSAAACGFKGSRKSTPFAAQVAGETVAKKVWDGGMQTLTLVRISGAGAGRESAVRGLQAHMGSFAVATTEDAADGGRTGSSGTGKVGLAIHALMDCTPMPHNGCRKRKARRV